MRCLALGGAGRGFGRCLRDSRPWAGPPDRFHQLLPLSPLLELLPIIDQLVKDLLPPLPTLLLKVFDADLKPPERFGTSVMLDYPFALLGREPLEVLDPDVAVVNFSQEGRQPASSSVSGYIWGRLRRVRRRVV